jgi:hypothetical protein
MRCEPIPIFWNFKFKVVLLILLEKIFMHLILSMKVLQANVLVVPEPEFSGFGEFFATNSDYWKKTSLKK